MDTPIVDMAMNTGHVYNEILTFRKDLATHTSWNVLLWTEKLSYLVRMNGNSAGLSPGVLTIQLYFPQIYGIDADI